MAQVVGTRASAPEVGLGVYPRWRLWLFRTYLAVVALATCTLPLALAHHGRRPGGGSDVLVATAIAAVSVLNVEIGRLLEGGTSGSQRPHKALSAWAFTTALLLPTWWLLPVVVLTYAHAWWRGLRAPVWKWVGSGAYLVLCGLSAAMVSVAIAGRRADLMAGPGLRGMLAVVAGAAAFLLVETVLFHGSAYLNRPSSEVWLRATLRSRSFYATEAAVLLVGGLSAAVWSGGPWFVLLLIPVYALTQRAALHVPLQQRADHDEKTGVLRFEAWWRSAEQAVERSSRRSQPWSVLFIDIDHFKRFNDTWGHLAGDRALFAVAHTIAHTLHEGAILGRFGGEEFCVFHEGAERSAVALADRLRTTISELELPGVRGLTVSVGVATVDRTGRADLRVALDEADHALFAAKQAGRNATSVRAVDAH